MPQSFSCLHTHIVFSTKHRYPFITPDLAGRLYPYLGGLVRNRKCTLLRVGGIADHVHLLIRTARDIAVSDLVSAVKSNSTGWVHDTFPEGRSFSWQQGYAAFAVSLSGVDDVAAYIERQEEHHKVSSFQDEYRAFLTKHGIEFDEKYMWD